MKTLNNLSIALMRVQDQCIGLFKPRFSNTWELVVENTDQQLTCVTVGHLFGLQTLHISASEGVLKLFPRVLESTYRAGTLTDMMGDPIKFNTWYKENIDNS